MQLATLQELYIEELRDLYSAEQMILKALPRMIQAAHSNELRDAFQMHFGQTQEQVQRLDRIFSDLEESPTGKTCKGMAGLIQEAEEFLREQPVGMVCDAGMISMAQRIEHYEIAGYGCCRTYAKQLARKDDAGLLQKTLDEEGQADHKLTKIAESRVNEQADVQRAA